MSIHDRILFAEFVRWEIARCTFIATVGTCALVFVDLHTVRAAEPSWQLAFSDGFDRERLGDDWRPLSGKWRIVDGWLTGRGGEIICTTRFPGPQRVEFDARSAERSAVGDHPISDLTAILAASEAGYKGGYFLGFGSENNTCSKVLVRAEEIARSETRVTPFKTHRVVCEWDGETLTHTVDGKVIQRVKPAKRLAGVPHQKIGLYMWENGYVDNLKVFTPTGEAIRARPPRVEMPQAVDLGLVSNSSFERIIPGLRPIQPQRWILQRWSRDDRLELLTDASRAHRGQRFVRAYAPGQHGLRMHSMRAGGIQLKPGTDYVARAWARTAPGSSATLTTEPGGKLFQLTKQWSLYTTSYHHPADEEPAIGFYFSIHGGPADVDDISLVEKGQPEPTPPELENSWSELSQINSTTTWTQPEAEVRIPITVQETVGHDARDYPVALSIRELFRTYALDFFRPEKISVVDPSTDGARSVPVAAISTDRNPFLSQDDQIIFLVDCPSQSRKTYYLYVGNFEREAELFTPTDRVPDAINRSTDYPYRLAVAVQPQERRYTVTARMLANRLVAEIVGYGTRQVTARLVSPDRQRQLPLELSQPAPERWRVARNFRLPPGLPSGVWSFEADFDPETDHSTSRRTSVVIGTTLWGGNTSQRIFEDDPPAFGRERISIAAAGNQWESFQVALASQTTLRQVSLRCTEFLQRGGSGRLESAAISIDCVEQALSVEGFRGGDMPDPLVPWEAEDVPAGGQRVAFVTVKVEEPLPQGTYDGKLRAVISDRVVAEIDVELVKFSFSLPKSRSFTPVFSAALSSSPFGRSGATQSKSSVGRFGFERTYPMSYRRITLDMFRLLGERHITPFYYSSSAAPYKIPWTYTESTKAGVLDFSYADESLSHLEDLDVKYLFYNAENRVREHGGCMTAFVTGTHKRLYGWHGTDLGREMFAARMQPLAGYLHKQGWADRALFYTNDEAFGHTTGPPIPGRSHNELITEYSRMIHATHSGFQTFTADNAGSRWIEPLSETDHFVGVMSESNQQRFRAQGSKYWGLYNRYTLLTRPLGNARIVGLDCYLRGWDHHFQLHALNAATNPWINQHRYSRSGSKNGFFIVGGNVGQGFSHHIYPWPEWRKPWSEGLPSIVSSLRIEALRESIDDYEYMRLLDATIEHLPVNSAAHARCVRLREQVVRLVARANTGDDYRYGGSHSVFLFNGRELDDLIREVGRVVDATQ